LNKKVKTLDKYIRICYYPSDDGLSKKYFGSCNIYKKPKKTIHHRQL